MFIFLKIEKYLYKFNTPIITKHKEVVHVNQEIDINEVIERVRINRVRNQIAVEQIRYIQIQPPWS